MNYELHTAVNDISRQPEGGGEGTITIASSSKLFKLNNKNIFAFEGNLMEEEGQGLGLASQLSMDISEVPNIHPPMLNSLFPVIHAQDASNAASSQ